MVYQNALVIWERIYYFYNLTMNYLIDKNSKII